MAPSNDFAWVLGAVRQLVAVLLEYLLIKPAGVRS
jgi:hypothetical protein